MTTIIATRGALYADTLCTYNIPFKTGKIVRIGDSLYGAAGEPFEAAHRFFDWKRGSARPDYADDTELDVIELNKFGIVLWSRHLVPVSVKDKTYAIGSGAPFAIGALAAGATPEQALKIAARFDPNTRPPIEVMTL